MKRWRRLFRCFALAACLAACLSAAGCGVQEGDKKGHDVALTIWHVYGGQTDSPFNAVIDEYNQTAGKEEGIYVQVASVTNTNTIHEDVLAAANGDPGAAELPDMFVSYPKTVLAMPDDGILLNYEEYFDEEARKAFLPEFLEEGRIGGRQLILPIAKSTEIMYVNQTAFDRFAAQTGARLEEMETWEGLFDLAERYTAWTDEQTPAIPGDGKAFFAHDYHFDYFQVGTEALGEDFFGLAGKWLCHRSPEDRRCHRYRGLLRQCPVLFGHGNLCGQSFGEDPDHSLSMPGALRRQKAGDAERSGHLHGSF